MASKKAAELVRKIIQSNKVVVFSKSFCPFAARTKALLNDIGAKNVSIKELDLCESGEEVQNALCDLTGRATVPNVFVNGSSIGGADDTLSLYNCGKLQELLISVGSLETDKPAA